MGSFTFRPDLDLRNIILYLSLICFS
ncbi:hypothetical protein NMYAN_10214 [Nitrosomonas nitrosa]|uniref:Uncharacterized protein n=1 Tax=Nitrosomonas nitrosa TaxID=52442 RepID=A0A8H9D7J5_9PROT|nr:hypothetical protein NMYAN_10214 [Nitrosomonas nitrosa]